MSPLKERDKTIVALTAELKAIRAREVELINELDKRQTEVSDKYLRAIKEALWEFEDRVSPIRTAQIVRCPTGGLSIYVTLCTDRADSCIPIDDQP